MKLKLLEIRGIGTDNERVWIQASEDVDLGDYIVTDTTFTGNGKKVGQVTTCFRVSAKTGKEKAIRLPSHEGWPRRIGSDHG
jgi:hypothetical protein